MSLLIGRQVMPARARPISSSTGLGLAKFGWETMGIPAAGLISKVRSECSSTGTAGSKQTSNLLKYP